MSSWPNYQRYNRVLSPVQYYILVALAHRPLYVYALAQQINSDSQGSVVPKRSSVKLAVETLHHWGLIAIDDITSYQEAPRGPSYTLTASGQNRLKQEISHLERAVRMGNLGLKRAEQPQATQTPT